MGVYQEAEYGKARGGKRRQKERNQKRPRKRPGKTQEKQPEPTKKDKILEKLKTFMWPAFFGIILLIVAVGSTVGLQQCDSGFRN